jgi:hypothetical protein
MRIVVILLLALALAGCKTGPQAACQGHGQPRGIVSGIVKCSDGTWQKP